MSLRVAQAKGISIRSHCLKFKFASVAATEALCICLQLAVNMPTREVTQGQVAGYLGIAWASLQAASVFLEKISRK